MSDAKQTIRDMARLTVLTGKINAVQEKNLKMLPLIIFDRVKLAKIDYDLSRENGFARNNYVKFELETDGPQNHFEKRCFHLESVVRELFWSDVQVVVMINGEAVYRSPIHNEKEVKELIASELGE